MPSTIDIPVDQKVYYCNCTFNGEKNSSIPYSITLDPGHYKIELWGASGGNTKGGEGKAGKGGYAQAEIFLNETKTYFLYIGGQGGESYDNLAAIGGCNGGGNGFFGTNQTNHDGNGGGGGATDIRTNQDLNSRILVASGGGGSGIGFPGGDGGATEGFLGGGWYNTYEGWNETYTGGTGGTQYQGGNGGIFKDNNNLNFAPNGTLGYGGSGHGIQFHGGGGGGGYYGGGGSFESGGGGGSGFILSGLLGFLKSGQESFPSPTPHVNETGHIGDGFARITTIISIPFPTQQQYHNIPISIFGIFLATFPS